MVNTRRTINEPCFLVGINHHRVDNSRYFNIRTKPADYFHDRTTVWKWHTYMWKPSIINHTQVLQNWVRLNVCLQFLLDQVYQGTVCFSRKLVRKTKYLRTSKTKASKKMKMNGMPHWPFSFSTSLCGNRFFCAQRLGVAHVVVLTHVCVYIYICHVCMYVCMYVCM